MIALFLRNHQTCAQYLTIEIKKDVFVAQVFFHKINITS